VIGAHALVHLHVGAVHGSDGQRAVEAELHVAGARRFKAGRGYLLRQVRRRDDAFCQADVVVGQEDHFEQPAHSRIVVDGAGDVVGQLDDQLGLVITGRRLAGEDLHPRHPVGARLGTDRLVQRHGVQQVEQLALVLVDTFDLHVEHRRRVHRNAQALVDDLGQCTLTVQALVGEGFAEGLFLGEGFQFAQAGFHGVENVRTQGFHQHLGELGVGLVQPAAEGNAVGFVVDAVWVELVQFGEHRAAHQLGVQARHAIDAVGAEERQVTHAHAATIVFFDQRHSAQHVKIVDTFGAQRVDVLGIDQVDDLHVPRQHAFHQAYRPGFQRLGQQGVVGVGQGFDRDLPSGVPSDVVQIHQLAHQLGHGDGRVGVVELDRRVFAQAQYRAMHVFVAAQQVLQRGGDEEVFLTQAQLLPCFGAIRRVKHPGDAFSAGHFGNGAQVVTGVEALQVQVLHRPCTPQAQGVDACTAPTDHRRVIGHGAHGLAGRPHLDQLAGGVRQGFHAAAKADRVDHFSALELPRVAEIQPAFGLLLLPAIDNRLAEQAMFITDAITVTGNAQG